MGDKITAIDLSFAMRRHHWWDDLRAPAGVAKTGPTAPTWDTTEVGWNFDNNPGANESVQINMQMPHSWVEGSDVVPHIHWCLTVNGAAGEDVAWVLQYRVASIGGTFPAGFTTLGARIIDVSGYSARDHIVTTFTNFTMAGHTISAMMDIKLNRQTSAAEDDHESPVILKEFDLHYRKNALGSWQDSLKWG